MADIKQTPETEISFEALDTSPLSEQPFAVAKEENKFIGTVLEGKYRIEAKLGQGGMGIVYRAMHIFMERPVAIKLLHKEHLSNAAAIERFKREARAAGRIQHPNATAVLDFGVTSNNIFYLVMEYLEGRTLRERLKVEGALSIVETIRIISQVCEAVEAAHKCNVIHRDLKPDNIFLQNKDGVEIVKVLDFGIAKITQGESNATLGVTTEMVMGTPQYMSPEQCLAKPLAPTTDIYSLGIIIFEMLSGKLPFNGDTLLSIALKHLNDPPPSLAESCPNLPSSIGAATMRALAKNPHQRQRSAHLLAQELQQALTNSTKETTSRIVTTCANLHCSHPKPGDAGRCSNCKTLLIGALVRHRYEVQQMIGKGGFGITYLVNDQDCLNELRILKELRAGLLKDENEEIADKLSDTAERLFKREAQVLLNLQHPGIPKLYAYFQEGNYTYLVQDFIPGRTLSEEIDSTNQIYNEAVACNTLLEIADILEYLHSQSPPIVHRDIKPQNLIRHADGRLLLIDFGAVCQAASNPNLSRTIIGSPGYVPPEQFLGHPVPQSDLYAAGVSVLHLLTGIHPIELYNNKTQSIEWQSHVQVSPQFAAILNDLLTANVEKRLTSATELKRRLQELIGEKPASTINLPTLESAIAIEVSAPAYAQEKETLLISEQAKSLIDAKPARPERSADENGSLEKTPIISLLEQFYRKRSSGLLICTYGNTSKAIYFDKGSVVFASSTLASEQLGEIFTRIGCISATDLEQVKEKIETQGLNFITTLIEMGYITSTELKLFVSSQVSNIVYSLFDWENGTYEIWYDHPVLAPIELSLSSANLIFEGLRRLSNIEALKRWLGDFRHKLTATGLLLSYQVLNLSPKEAFILSRIDGITSLEDLLLLGGLPEVETLKAVCGLLTVGMLEWQKEEKIPARTDTASNSKIMSQKPPAPNFDIQSASAFCYEVENMLRLTEGANHYAVLGIRRGASEEEIEHAYQGLAKKFHPQRSVELAKYNISLNNELETISLRLLNSYRHLTKGKYSTR